MATCWITIHKGGASFYFYLYLIHVHTTGVSEKRDVKHVKTEYARLLNFTNICITSLLFLIKTSNLYLWRLKEENQLECCIRRAFWFHAFSVRHGFSSIPKILSPSLFVIDIVTQLLLGLLMPIGLFFLFLFVCFLFFLFVCHSLSFYLSCEIKTS